MTTKLREGLPPVPARMATRPLDERGYPVPYFVAWVDGKPDFRVTDPVKIHACMRFNWCWLCGEPLGRHATYVIGPMCAVNRISSEPPSHYDCAEFAARACPFLTRPRAQRREAGLPDEVVEPAGIGLDRNPGVALLWTTRDPLQVLRVPNGVLFAVGRPESLEWYAEGRLATREEIMASLEGGCELLRAMAEKEGPAAVADLEAKIAAAKGLVR